MQYIILIILASSILTVLIIAISVHLRQQFVQGRLDEVEKEKVKEDEQLSS